MPIENESIAVGEDLSSGLPRLYVAGDCAGQPRQISTSVGEGAKAALNLMRELRDK